MQVRINPCCVISHLFIHKVAFDTRQNEQDILVEFVNTAFRVGSFPPGSMGVLGCMLTIWRLVAMFLWQHPPHTQHAVICWGQYSDCPEVLCPEMS